MPRAASLGRAFGRLWVAYAVSALGTRLAFGALPLIAIHVLGAGPAQVSALAAAGAAVGALVAVPLGPWAERRRKRPVMIAADLVRCAALLSIPAGYALGLLTFPHLLLVAVLVAAADITFGAVSGAFLRSVVRREDLLAANARLESTTWTATVLGPPLGGVAVAFLGPVATVLADAASHLLSALGIRAIGADGGESAQLPASASASGSAPGSAPAARRGGGLLAGWRYLLAHPVLRPLLFNTVLVNALVMATEPLLAVLLLGRLGYTPWQYGLALAVPCLGGLLGSRLSGRLVARYGRSRVLRGSGALRACWPVLLVFVAPGAGGLVLVMAVEFVLITCIGVFNPVLATTRLEQLAPELTTRALSAWSVTAKAATAALTALGGVLAALTGPRPALAAAGLLLLFTPLLLLPRRAPAPGGGRAGRNDGCPAGEDRVGWAP